MNNLEDELIKLIPNDLEDADTALVRYIIEEENDTTYNRFDLLVGSIKLQAMVFGKVNLVSEDMEAEMKIGWTDLNSGRSWKMRLVSVKMRKGLGQSQIVSEAIRTRYGRSEIANALREISNQGIYE